MSTGMRGRHQQVGILAMAAALAASSAMPAQAQERRHAFDLPSETLERALTELSLQSSQQIIFSRDIVAGRMSAPLRGLYSTDAALALLLRGSGLSAERTPGGTIMIRVQQPRARLQRTRAVQSAPQPQLEAEPVVAWASGDQLEDITVTARRIEERLQSVPISVTALGGAALRQRSVQTVTDLNKIAPNVIFNPYPFDTTSLTLAIRGQKQNEINLTADQSVGVYVDGFYYPRPVGLRGALNDVSRIEILRGPQGTLFGRNTTGGALNVTTADPTDQPGASADITVGNYGLFRGAAVVNLPLAERVGLRLVGERISRDGYGKDINGNDLADEHSWYVRGKLKAELGSHVTTTLSASYARSRSRGAITRLSGISDGELPGGALTLEAAAELAGFSATNPYTPGAVEADDAAVNDQIPNALATLARIQSLPFYRSGSESGGYSRFEGVSFGLDTRVELNDTLSLRSLTGYQHFTRDYFADYDGTPFTGIDAVLDSADNYFSQEVQLLGNTGPVSWVAGAYYGHETGTDFATGIAFPALSGPFSVNTFTPRVKNTSIAGFVQVNWTFAPDWRLTAGARYSRDYRRIDTSSTTGGECMIPAPGVDVTPPGAALCPQRFADTFRKPSWLISIDHQFTPDVLAYAKIARGYRSGGQNPQSTNAAAAFGSFKPEIITEYEVGLKTELFDRSLRVNLAAYYDDYRNIQRTIQVPAGLTVATRTSNAASGRIWGLESEVEWRVVRAMTVGLTAGYNNARYRKYEFDLPGVGLQDLSRTAFDTPRYDGTLYTRIILPTRIGDAALNIDYHWQSKQNYSLGAINPQRTTQDPFGLLSARLSLAIPSLNAEAAVFGRNLTQAHYFVTGNAAEESLGLDQVIVGEPRTFGIQFIKRFGGV